ncbi:hypothetical protein K438DRAFT_908324 [Mycena galopus ATCC 62051]|nr:hypothetical protein K438DRAFT_908324 [Mycena galopus ATCC 62051]
MGVRLPGWGVEDEERVAAAVADKSSSSHAHSRHGRHHGNPLSPRRRSPVHPPLHIRHPRPRTLPLPHTPTQMRHTTKKTTLPRTTPAALFHAASSAQVVHPPRGIRAYPQSTLFIILPSTTCVSRPSSFISILQLIRDAGGECEHGPRRRCSTRPQADSSAYSSGSSRGGLHSTTYSQAGSHASSASSSYASYKNSYASSNTSTSKNKWWPLGNTGTKGWSSDAGWGCTLRTSQSLLASALGRVGEPSLIPALAPFSTLRAHALHRLTVMVHRALVVVTRIRLEEGQGVQKVGDRPMLLLLGIRLGWTVLI